MWSYFKRNVLWLAVEKVCFCGSLQGLEFSLFFFRRSKVVVPFPIVLLSWRFLKKLLAIDFSPHVPFILVSVRIYYFRHTILTRRLLLTRATQFVQRGHVCISGLFALNVLPMKIVKSVAIRKGAILFHFQTLSQLADLRQLYNLVVKVADRNRFWQKVIVISEVSWVDVRGFRRCVSIRGDWVVWKR